MHEGEVVNVILGPVPCHDCGVPIVWNGESWLQHPCARVLCMTPDEWTAWSAANALVQPQIRAGRPCTDCTPLFAATMRAIWRCSGTPGRQVRGPDKAPRRRAVVA